MTHELGPLPEPLFLLHCGAMFGGERDEWDVEANSGAAVDALADKHPGESLGLYDEHEVRRRIAAEVARAVAAERAKWSNLTPVIQWLENGCDPKEAAKELRFYQAKATRGAQAHGQTPGSQG